MRWAAPVAGSLLPLLMLCAGCATESAPHRGEAVGRTLASTVQLVAEREGGGRRAGSGVVLAVQPQLERTLVLTTAHLLEPPANQSVYVIAPPSRERREARVLAVDGDADLALLEAPLLEAAPADLSRGAAWLGDTVWVVAFPWGGRRTLVNGVVSQIAWDEGDGGGEPTEGPVSLIDAPVSYGSSGGGVFARETGALVGVVRGYRTAQLSLPIAGVEPVQLPLAGETTVIPATRILCFVTTAERDGLIASAPALPPVRKDDC